jgi:hypothetical protein
MEALLPILTKNPHKSLTAEYIPMPGESDSKLVEESTESQYGVDWARLHPPGPVSLYLWSSNPEYRAGSDAIRRSLLNETIVKLQERVQRGEVTSGRKISRAKLSEALGMTVENASEENFEALEKIVSCLGNVQWIRIHENEKKITCIPEDLRTWRADFPILWTRERYRSAGEISGKKEFRLMNLGKWIGDREDEGFSFTYPHAEGTMESLKAAWNALNRGLPRTKNEKGRPLKEDYAAALGRVQVFEHLRSETGGL